MNQASVDYLYQIIPPASDRPAQAPRSDGGYGFGEHLNQASASVFDLMQPTKRDTSPAAKPTDSARDDSSLSSSTAPADSPRSNQSSSSKPNEPDDLSNDTAANDELCAAGTSGDCQPAESSADDDRDDDHDEDVVSVATVANPSSNVAKTETSDNEAENIQETKAKVETAAESESSGGEKANQGVSVEVTEEESSQTVAIDEVALASEGKPASHDAKAGKDKTIAAESKTPANAREHSERHAAAKPQGDGVATTTTGDETGTTKIPMVEQATVMGDAETAQSEEANINDAKAPLADKNGPETSDESQATDTLNPAADKPQSNSNLVNTSPTSVIANNIAAATTIAESEKPKGEGDSATKPVSANSESAVGPLGRALRTATDITRAGRAAQANEGPQVDPSRFVGRVAKAFQTANERGGTVQIRLAPPELGALKIQLTMKDGAMSANLEADNAHARRLLLDHLPALRDRLAEQNIRVERFDVDLRQENNSGQDNPHGSNQNPYQQQADQSDSRRATRSNARTNQTAATPSIAPVAAAQISTTEINLVV